MSKARNQNTVPLSLLGTALFAWSTLAALQTPEANHASQRAPAAQRECDISGLSSGPRASCELRERKTDGTPGDVTATINIQIKPDAPKKTLYGAKPVENAEKPVDFVEVEVTAAADCAECRQRLQSTSSLRAEASRFKDLDELASWVKREVIDREARKAMDDVKQQVKNQKVLAENEEKCLTRGGVKLFGKDRMECRIEKLASFDEEKASDYFHKYLRDDLQAALQSDNPTDRLQAMQLLNKLNNESNSTMVKNSARDLAAFGQYNQKQSELLMQVTSLPANDPRRSALLQQLGQIKQQWGTYFQMRGYQTNNLASTMTDSLVYSLMAQDIGEYQRRLDSSYSSIINQNRVQMNGGGVVPGGNNVFMAAGQGRTARGMVNGYAGAPDAMMNNMPGPGGFSNNPMMQGPSQFQQPFPQQRFPQQPGGFNQGMVGPQNFNRGGMGKPQLGQPVGR